MANFVYTFADLKRAVTHALGGVPDQNLTPDEVVNDALQFYCNLLPWRFKTRTLNLNSTNAQSYILLPTDFEQMLTLSVVASNSLICRPVTLDQIVKYRQSGSGVIADTAYAVSFQPQASVTAEPLPIIEVYPTPGSTTTGSPFFLTGEYIRRIPALSGDTSIPDIPSPHHAVLKQLCRAMAVSQEEQSRGADWAMFMDMLPAVEKIDGGMPGYLGRARGSLRMGRSGPDIAAQTSKIGP